MFGKNKQEVEEKEPEKECSFQGLFDDNEESKFNCNLQEGYSCDKSKCPFWNR